MRDTIRKRLPGARIFDRLVIDGRAMIVVETDFPSEDATLEPADQFDLRNRVVLDFDGTPYLANERPDLAD